MYRSVAATYSAHVMYAYVVLLHRGKRYSFIAEDSALKGSLSCDCARSALIRRWCDPEFPELPCGMEVMVLDFEEVGRAAIVAGIECGHYALQ